MIYSVVLVLGVQQSESIICVHIPALQHSFPGWVITEYWVEFPVLYSRSLLVVYFMCSSVYMWRRKWQRTPVVLPGKPVGRGAWRVPVRGVSKCWTRLSNGTTTVCMCPFSLAVYPPCLPPFSSGKVVFHVFDSIPVL